MDESIGQAPPRDLLSLPEAWHTLHISDFTMRAIRRQGLIRTVKIGKRVLVPRTEIERYIREQLGRTG